MGKKATQAAGEVPATWNDAEAEKLRKKRPPKRAPGAARMMKPGEDTFEKNPKRPRPFDGATS